VDECNITRTGQLSSTVSLRRSSRHCSCRSYITLQVDFLDTQQAVTNRWSIHLQTQRPNVPERNLLPTPYSTPRSAYSTTWSPDREMTSSVYDPASPTRLSLNDAAHPEPPGIIWLRLHTLDALRTETSWRMRVIGADAALCGRIPVTGL
jgi:hypothetical protein